MPPKKKKKQQQDSWIDYLFSNCTPNLKTSCCELKEVTKWFILNCYQNVPLGDVDFEIVASYLCTPLVLYGSHRKWQSCLSESYFNVRDGFVPTVVCQATGEGNVHHWTEKCFEVYLDDTFLPLLFANTVEFTSFVIDKMVYYVLATPPPTADQTGYVKTILLKWESKSDENKYWIFNPVSGEHGDSGKDVGMEIGKKFWDWTISNIFYVKSLLPMWICFACSFENQITQHCCNFCRMERKKISQEQHMFAKLSSRLLSKQRDYDPEMDFLCKRRPFECKDQNERSHQKPTTTSGSEEKRLVLPLIPDRKKTKRKHKIYNHNQNENKITKNVCTFCKEANLHLQECSGCQTVLYCNRTCQKRHWGHHKFDCYKAQLKEEQDKNKVLSFNTLKLEAQVEKEQRENEFQKWAQIQVQGELEIQVFVLNKQLLEAKELHCQDVFFSQCQEKIQEQIQEQLTKERSAHELLKKRVLSLQERKMVLSEKKTNEIEHFFDKMKHKEPHWVFCTIGGDGQDERLLHLCEWELVSPEMNMRLKKQETSISLGHGVDYKIEYSLDFQSAKQTRTSTKFTRNLKCLSEPKSYKILWDLFDLNYWLECAKSNPCGSRRRLKLKKHLALLNWIFHPRYFDFQVSVVFSPRTFEPFLLQHKLWEEEGRNNVLFLFHGLKKNKSDVVNLIIKNGFQLHYSNPGNFSRGFYFSESFEVCFENYTQAKTTEIKSGRSVLLCAVNVGIPFVNEETTTWDCDNPCTKNGELLQSVKFQHLGAPAYVVPLSQQIHLLAVYQELETEA